MLGTSYLSLWQTMLLVTTFFALGGMITVHPFNSPFQLSFAPVIFSSLLMYFRRLSVEYTAFFGSIVMVILRVVTDVSTSNMELMEILLERAPTFFFYIIYSIGFNLTRVREQRDNVLMTVMLLTICDGFSNAAELAMRGELFSRPADVTFGILAGVAIARAVMAVFICYGLREAQAVALAEEQVAHYNELTLLIAQLKAELFYLRKSSRDIEQVMVDSYGLYQEMQNCQCREQERHLLVADQALAIARNIHEVKKDYQRVVAGIEKVLEPSEGDRKSLLSGIFQLIEQNARRVLAQRGADVSLQFECRQDFWTDQHYVIVSILNNLLINAIEACGDKGAIQVSESIEKDTVIFEVQDSGCGIAEADRELIFQPGYSTKFDRRTGAMSTGLGLSLVQNLTKLLGGQVVVTSGENGGTYFYISIPTVRLIA